MMPGAPPVKLVSVAVIRATPFCEKVSVEPVTLRFNWVPAARAPWNEALPSWVKDPLIRLKSISSGLPPFQKYRPR
jgi:hypothetical protein